MCVCCVCSLFFHSAPFVSRHAVYLHMYRYICLGGAYKFSQNLLLFVHVICTICHCLFRCFKFSNRRIFLVVAFRFSVCVCVRARVGFLFSFFDCHFLCPDYCDFVIKLFCAVLHAANIFAIKSRTNDKLNMNVCWNALTFISGKLLQHFPECVNMSPKQWGTKKPKPLTYWKCQA